MKKLIFFCCLLLICFVAFRTCDGHEGVGHNDSNFDRPNPPKSPITLSTSKAPITSLPTNVQDYTIMFYSLDNLFDTTNDVGVNDSEFTPLGAKRWNFTKYSRKLSNLGRVISGVKAENSVFPAVIGVSEVENKGVLRNLASLPELASAKYQIVHFNSPDKRGMDCAFLYRADLFSLQGSRPYSVIAKSNRMDLATGRVVPYLTRDIVTMWGTLHGEKFFFMCNYWPSRYGGASKSSYSRCAAAAVARHIKDSLLVNEPQTKIVIMGDLNDNPSDTSVKRILGTSSLTVNLTGDKLYNPFESLYKKGYGTSCFQDKWYLFDQIIVSANLIQQQNKGLQIVPSSKGNYGQVYKMPFMLTSTGRFKGYPLPTWNRNKFLYGYSDRLPVYINLQVKASKRVKTPVEKPISSSEKRSFKKHTVMFYSVENLFDTIDTPGVSDSEFTPTSSKRWNTAKYKKKLQNLERVIYGVTRQSRSFPIVVGISEIENRAVLKDLLREPKMAMANYHIAHYDSPDKRGLDVAFFYRPDMFKLEGSRPYAVRPKSNRIDPVTGRMLPYLTRDVLAMWGEVDGEKVFFMCNYWPSRYGGAKKSAPARVAAASVVRHITDSLAVNEPATKVVIMGDMNDDPRDASMTEVLGAAGNAENLPAQGLFNPFYQIHKDGYGTLCYRGNWNLFDNIIVSNNLVNAEAGKLKIIQSKKGYYGYIYKKRFMMTPRGKYKGYPLRTWSGTNFLNGYSDHLPVYIHLQL